MSAANIAMSTAITRNVARPPLVRCHSRKPSHGKKTRVISGFLVFSSLFMVCCVSKPVFEARLLVFFWYNSFILKVQAYINVWKLNHNLQKSLTWVRSGSRKRQPGKWVTQNVNENYYLFWLFHI
jgi:hypothetical protein